jgi:hypothetical protein
MVKNAQAIRTKPPAAQAGTSVLPITCSLLTWEIRTDSVVFKHDKKRDHRGDFQAQDEEGPKYVERVQRGPRLAPGHDGNGGRLRGGLRGVSVGASVGASVSASETNAEQRRDKYTNGKNGGAGMSFLKHLFQSRNSTRYTAEGLIAHTGDPPFILVFSYPAGVATHGSSLTPPRQAWRQLVIAAVVRCQRNRLRAAIRTST